MYKWLIVALVVLVPSPAYAVWIPFLDTPTDKQDSAGKAPEQKQKASEQQKQKAPKQKTEKPKEHWYKEKQQHKKEAIKLIRDWYKQTATTKEEKRVPGNLACAKRIMYEYLLPDLDAFIGDSYIWMVMQTFKMLMTIDGYSTAMTSMPDSVIEDMTRAVVKNKNCPFVRKAFRDSYIRFINMTL